MFSDHPTMEDLKAFLRDASQPASPTSDTRVTRHLLADCPVCRQRLSAAGWGPKRLARLIDPVTEETASQEAAVPAVTEGYDYSRAFAAAERSVSALLMPDPPAVEPLSVVLSRLDLMSAEEQARQVSTEPFVQPAVIRALIDRSHDMRYQDAEEMLHFANLARIAADACAGADALDNLRRADLRARAWGQYGNALRVLGRPREAQEALSTAQQHRQAGTGDPMLRAWLLERLTPLAIFHRSLDEAVERCEEASAIYEQLGERHLLASTMVQKAIAETYAGKTESAVRILNEAIPLIDKEEDPHILLAACHNLIRCYIDLDQPEQALLLYTESHELYKEFDDPLIRLRAAWQEGQLLRDLGHLRAAEEALLRARQGYVERKLVYEAALVSLELATVYVKMGLVEELRSTVTATIPIFHALRVKLATLAALLQLRQVADQEQQALELIRVLSAQIEPLPKNRLRE